jgi:hypothetical protein
MGTAVSSTYKTATPAATSTPARRASWRYFACLGLLTAAALSVGVLPGYLGVFLQKDPVPLKKSLRQFDARLLGPRYERHPATDQIPKMSEDMEQSLGTGEYLQILLNDTAAPSDSAVRVAKLFITYYTGQPDMVPHVPDECYLAGGFSPIGASTAHVDVPESGVKDGRVPVRAVEFQAPASRRSMAGGDTTAVMYFFHVNGGFATTRDGVRLRLSDPTQRVAYYAKIEVYFSNYALTRNAGKDASLAALAPLLERLLPQLYEEHFDLSKLTPGADAAH